MPATSKIQQQFFGAALARKRAGKSRQGDPKMPAHKMEEFASTSRKNLPYRKKAIEHMMKGGKK